MIVLFLFQLICLLVFAAAAIAWVCHIWGIKELASDEKRILNGAFGVSVVGGLAALVGPEFFGPSSLDESEETTPISVQNPEQPKSDDNQPDPFKSPVVIASRVPDDNVIQEGAATPDQGAQNGDATEDAAGVEEDVPLKFDPAVSQFLKDNELVRPTMDAKWQEAYPDCAKRARTANLTKTAAQNCMKELDVFNSRYLVSYQEAYGIYVPSISQLSFSLSKGPVLDFVKSEAEGFNRATNEEARTYRAASQDLDGDYSRLRRQAY